MKRGCLLSSPVGNQVQLGPIYTVYRQLSIKWQKKQVFLVSLLQKNETGEGRGLLCKGEACLILKPSRLFGGGCLLEHRHLFMEIR